MTSQQTNDDCSSTPASLVVSPLVASTTTESAPSVCAATAGVVSARPVSIQTEQAHAAPEQASPVRDPVTHSATTCCVPVRTTPFCVDLCFVPPSPPAVRCAAPTQAAPVLAAIDTAQHPSELLSPEPTERGEPATPQQWPLPDEEEIVTFFLLPPTGYSGPTI